MVPGFFQSLWKQEDLETKRENQEVYLNKNPVVNWWRIEWSQESLIQKKTIDNFSNSNNNYKNRMIENAKEEFENLPSSSNP